MADTIHYVIYSDIHTNLSTYITKEDLSFLAETQSLGYTHVIYVPNPKQIITIYYLRVYT